METNKEQNEKDQPVSYGKRVLFGKSGKPKVFVKPPLPEGAMEVAHLYKIKRRAVLMVWGAAFVLFIAAIIVKLSLYHSSAPWLISLGSTLKTYPAFKLVDYFNEGRPEQYFLVLFFGFCYMLLLLINIIIKLTVDSFATTAYYYTHLNGDTSVLFFISLIVFVLFIFLSYIDITNPVVATGRAAIMNNIYQDRYNALFVSYLFVAPVISCMLVEMLFMFISLILYGFSEKFRTVVDNKVG